MHGTFTDEISAITEAIAERIGKQKYRIWFKDSAKFSLNENFLTVGVPNLFVSNWLEKHFLHVISEAVNEVRSCSTKVSFAVDGELAGRQRSVVVNSRVKPAAKGLVKKQLSSTSRKGLLNDKLKYKLESFVVGSSNELAYNAAKAVINQEKSPFNPLFIHGGYGVGKTHLMQGICNSVSVIRPGTNWLYLSAEDFVNQFVLALKTKKLEAFRRRMRQTDLLAIDDIHFLASKPSTQEEFLHTFNTVELAGKQVVLASDAHPRMTGEISEKLVNRFVSGMVVKINPPDFRTRCAICRQFACRSGQNISDGVISYIAKNIQSNVRELEGAVLKLVAVSSLQGRRINVELSKEILCQHLSRMDPIVHVSDIESASATYFGITTGDLHSSKKDRTVSLARRYSMYLARKHTKMSTPEIGRCTGNKNHATVLLACRKVKNELKNNTQLHWRSSAGNRVSTARTIVAQLEEAIAS